MSQVDELVDKLSGAIATAVKKAMSEANTPSIDDRLDELASAVAELAERSTSTEEPTLKAADLLSTLTEIRDGQEAMVKALDATVDRVNNIERGTAISKASPGQDTDTKKSTGSAIDAALMTLGKASRNGQQASVTFR